MGQDRQDGRGEKAKSIQGGEKSLREGAVYRKYANVFEQYTDGSAVRRHIAIVLQRRCIFEFLLPSFSLLFSLLTTVNTFQEGS